MSEVMDQIRGILTATPLRWRQLAELLPDDLLRRRPAPDEWSAAECLQHLVDTEQWVFPARVAALRAGHDIPAFDPAEQGSATPGDQPVAALAARFAALRADSLAALGDVAEPMFGLSGVHSELGRVTLGELVHEWAAHDFDHTIQAERALMQPYIEGCGPWQFYFAANRIEPGG